MVLVQMDDGRQWSGVHSYNSACRPGIRPRWRVDSRYYLDGWHLHTDGHTHRRHQQCAVVHFERRCHSTCGHQT